MSRRNLFKASKLALAAICAIWFAGFLELKYAVTAGIITVLSIQNTKRETMKTARNRGLAFACALFLAWLSYGMFGFTVLAFAVYLFLFALVCLWRKWPEAIAMDSVLISHFLAERSFSKAWILNEIGLFCIGTVFGILVNLHLRKSEKEFEALAGKVDDEIKGILHRMAENLAREDKSEYKSDCFKRLEERIADAKECALKNWNNSLFDATKQELDYIKMRENQSRVLKNIYQSIVMITILPEQTKVICGFIEQIEKEYRRENDVTDLLSKLEQILEQMKKEPLPVKREEFEARAVLFYMLKQLEEFLTLKHEYVKEGSEK